MKKLLLGALVALLPLTAMSATVLGIQAGGGSWTHAPSGDITASDGGAGTSADLENDLNLSKKTEGYSYFILEHPIPVIPNIKYVNTKLTSSGSGTANVSFTFNGTAYNTVTALTTVLELNQTDAILYYEILDNVVSLDFGLNAKTITGKASVNTDSTTFSATIPMLYVAAEISLPAGFAVAADISTISAAGNTVSDTTVKLTYTSDYYLGLEAGLRTQSYTLDVDSVKANMKFSGVFAGVYFKF